MLRPMSDLRAAAQRLSGELTAWRRHLHAHPELSGQEEQTAAFVAAELRKLGYAPAERIGGTHGVVALLAAGTGRAVALRADMDALPITEDSEVDYRSARPGVMHACGHDAHMAMLLGAARLLAERRAALGQPVKLIFQPSEELAPGGAAPLIAAGVLEDVACVFGLHVWSEMPVGSLGTRIGPFMSSVDDLLITIHGRGGHAAMPHQCIDPIVAAAELVLSVQTTVSRSLAMTDSAVVSVTQVRAGTAANIIPERACLRGTVRTLNAATRATVHRRLREIAEGVARAHGATAAVEVSAGYPVLVNDRQVVERALAAARSIGIGDAQLVTLPPQGGGEDFARYAEKVPAALVFLGARNEAKGCHHPHHHARFNIDEDALPIGAALLARFALAG